MGVSHEYYAEADNYALQKAKDTIGMGTVVSYDQQT